MKQDEFEHRISIVMIAVVVIFIVCLVFLSFYIGKASADTNITSTYSYNYSRSGMNEEPSFKKILKVKPEPPIQIDRHVLNKSDYEHDDSVLIAKPKEIIKEHLQTIPAMVIPVKQPENSSVKITATIESDSEEPINYPL